MGCFVFWFFFSSFSLVGFVFLVVYALYTPWGPFFGINTLVYQSKKKKKTSYRTMLKSSKEKEVTVSSGAR